MSFLTGTKNIPNFPRNVLTHATYQHVQSAQGMPQVRLDLRFNYALPIVTNPLMALGLLLDRSGSMTETYADGHVLNAANSVLMQVGGGGFELAFYDTHETNAGHIATYDQLSTAVRRNKPSGGGTMVYATLKGMIARLQARKPEVYVIVVTDGEFADKAQVTNLIINELIPTLPHDRLNALRLHFIGAGEEVDREFLRTLESDVANKGVPLVRHHAHAHLRHSHTDIADELSTVYLGVGDRVHLSDSSGQMMRAGILSDGALHDGADVDLHFLPRRTLIAVDYHLPHSGSLPLALSYVDGVGTSHELSLNVPLPNSTKRGAAPAAAPAGSPASAGAPAADGFHDPGGARSAPSLSGKAKKKFFIPGIVFPESAEEQAERIAQKAAIRHSREAEIQRASIDLRDLAMGGIPTSARERLSDLAGRDGVFTSNLAPDEIALLRAKGVRAKGLVTGSAMYHVGTAFASSTGDCEVPVLSQAYTNATALAVSRMEQEVRALGAHGAVGVRLTMVRHEWADKTVEVQIIGTAVESPGPAPREPWLSDLSGQEWWALNRAGYDPVGLVYGHCTWFILTTPYDEMIAQSWSNTEYVHHSQGISRARHVALDAVKKRARGFGASGVTGVHLARRMEEVRLSGPGENPVYEYEHHNITVSILGTAVVLRKDAPQSVVATRPVLSLRDNRIIPVAVHAASADFE